MGRKLGELCPLGEGELGPHLTQCGQGWGLPPCQVSSWSMQPFSHNRHEQKLGIMPPFWGGGAGSPSNTMSLGLRHNSYQVAFWSIEPFGHNRYGLKIGGGSSAPLGERNLGPHLTQITQCGHGQGLPAHQVSSGSVQLFGHNTPNITDRTGQTMVRQHRAKRFTNGRPKINHQNIV